MNSLNSFGYPCKLVIHVAMKVIMLLAYYNKFLLAVS